MPSVSSEASTDLPSRDALSAAGAVATDRQCEKSVAPRTPEYATLVTGMISQGLGIEAICFILALAREVLLDLVVDHGLPTPHDRPMRASSGAREWRQADYALLVTGWLRNWQAAGIAESIGRSKASVWAKARRLGFPRRSRRGLIWPADLLRPATRQTPPQRSRSGAEPSNLPAAASTRPRHRRRDLPRSQAWWFGDRVGDAW